MAQQIETQPRGVIGPTREEMRQTNKGELAPRGITKILLKVTGRPKTVYIAAGFTALGISSYLAYENTLVVSRPVNSLGDEISKRWNSIMGNKPESKSTQPITFQESPAGQPPDVEEKTPKKSLDQIIAQEMVKKNTKAGVYEMTVPPGRQAENLSEIPTYVGKENIPNISEDIFPYSSPEPIKSKGSEIIIPPSVVVGFNAFPEGRWIMSAEKGGEMRESLISPYATISGYLVAKEQQPDDESVMFAIELPYSDSPRDILKRNPDHTTLQSTTKTRKSGGLESQETIVQGGIVWIKLFKGTNPTHYPFVTTVLWGGEREFQASGLTGKNDAGAGVKPLAEYAKIGDPIRAIIPLSIDLADSVKISDGIDNYVNLYGYGSDINELNEQLRQTIEHNMQETRELIADSGKDVLLDQQLSGKRYVFTPKHVVFLHK